MPTTPPPAEPAPEAPALAPAPAPGVRGPHPSRRAAAVLLGLLLALAAAAALRVCVGEARLGWPRDDQVWATRGRRLVSGSLVGAALAVSGVALQALLRNPLAEPFILGLSSGAGVGVLAQTLLFHYLGVRLGGQEIGAVVGAASTMAVVFAAGRRRGVIDPLGLLLVGVVVSTINGAIIMALQYIYGRGTLNEDLARWMMGYINDQNVTTAMQAVLAALTLGGLAAAWARGPAMDVATFSDAEAESLGVHLGRLRALLFVIASVLTAGSVALAGPIAFVGLVCPHLVRLMLGPRHRPVVVGAALLGAALIVLADTAAAALDHALGLGLLPLGLFTAALGGPAFLWMLRPHLGRGQEN